MRQIRWLMVNGCMLVCLLFASFTQHQGAQNIALFLLWLSIAASLLLGTKAMRDAAVSKRATRSMPSWVVGAFDLVVLALLIYFGWWVTGVAYFIRVLLSSIFWDSVKKAIQAEQEAL